MNIVSGLKRLLLVASVFWITLLWLVVLVEMKTWRELSPPTVMVTLAALTVGPSAVAYAVVYAVGYIAANGVPGPKKLWLATSALWVVFFWLVVLVDFGPSIKWSSPAAIAVLAALTIGPPIVVYGAGHIAAWVNRGFRRDVE
jgi:hypothetical protein